MEEKNKTTQINFKPLNKHVLVLFKAVDEKTKSGLYKGTEQIKREQEQGDIWHDVIAISDDVEMVEVGDKICAPAKSFNPLEIDGVKCLLIHENVIIGKKEQ